MPERATDKLRELLAGRKLRELLAGRSGTDDDLFRIAPELARIVIDLLDNVAICDNDIDHLERIARMEPRRPCSPESPCDACQLRARVEALL